MTYLKKVPFFQFRKGLLAIILCLSTMIPQQQAHAGKATPFLITGAFMLALGVLDLVDLYKKKNSSSTYFEINMTLLPVIDYQIEVQLSHKQAGKEIILKPKITRGRYRTPISSEKTVAQFVKHAVCDPVNKLIHTPSIDDNDIDDILRQCLAWFAKNTMSFPHQMLGAKVDQLNKLVLPKLVYDTGTRTLDMVVTVVPYVKCDDQLSTITSNFTSGNGKHWETLSPIIPEQYPLSANDKNDWQLCHFAPETDGMEEPVLDSDKVYFYDFAIPGITHLHKTGFEFVIVTQYSPWSRYLSREHYSGYYWVIDRPWPSGLKTLKFMRTKNAKPIGQM